MSVPGVPNYWWRGTSTSTWRIWRETIGERIIVAAMATEGLEDMSEYFLPRWRSWCRDGRTWRMIWEGREVRSRTDYIMGTDRRLLGNISVRNPMHNSDHYMVLG